jgi:hypothetical protein
LSPSGDCNGCFSSYAAAARVSEVLFRIANSADLTGCHPALAEARSGQKTFSPFPANQLSFANRNDQSVNSRVLQGSLERSSMGRKVA